VNERPLTEEELKHLQVRTLNSNCPICKRLYDWAYWQRPEEERNAEGREAWAAKRRAGQHGSTT
jgi:hypothetical protein